MGKKADLQPPLGYPGGPCFVVQRIEDNVRSPSLREDLIDDVESGGSLSNSEAHKVYDIETEKGTGPFNKVEITAHAQYRMDLRSVTVPEVRLALKNFVELYRKGKSLGNQPVRKPGLRILQSQAQEWDSMMRARSPIKFVDPRQNLTLIFTTPRSGTARLVSTWWDNQSNPRAPGRCLVRKALRDPVQEWGTQTFTRPPQKEQRPPVLPIPNSSGKDRDQIVPRFEYSTPDHNQQLDQGTVTPGGSSTPGEQYGHPYKERGTQRRTAEDGKTAYTPNRRSWGKSRKQRGQSKIKTKRNYRKNRSKIKRKQKKYRRIQGKKPQFKKMQKIRRKMKKSNPNRFKRRGSVLTAPEIVFFTGPGLTMMGVVRSVSSFTGMVTFVLDGSHYESLSVPAFLSAVILATEADESSFFTLVDVEVGLEAYDDVNLDDVKRCAEVFGVDLTADEFRAKCKNSVGKVDLSDMTTDELEMVTNQFVAQIVDEGGSEREERDDSVDLGDEVEIDPTDDTLYYGEVELPEEIAEAQGRRAYINYEVEGLAGPEGYPSMYNPSNPYPKLDDQKPGDPSINGPLPIQKPVNDNGGSAKVIPTLAIDSEDLINHTYEHPWGRDRGEKRFLGSELIQKIAVRMAEISDQTIPGVHTRSQGIEPKLKRVNQKAGMWTFSVAGGHRGPYTVKLKGIRKGRTQNLSKLDIKVSCSCGFWRWQGPEYHAKNGGYLYGKPRGTASTPDIRDPSRVHHACKHVIAVFRKANKYFLRPLSKLGSDLYVDQPSIRRIAYQYMEKEAARYKCVPEGMKLLDYTRGYKQISNIRRIPIAKENGQVVIGLEDITDRGLLIRGKPYMSTREMEALFSDEVIIEEKVDGHPMIAIHEGYTFFCESLKVRHSVDYDNCPYSVSGWPDMLVCYDVLDGEHEPPYRAGGGKWLTRSEKETVCKMVGAPIVPLIFRGKIKPEDVPELSKRLSSFGSGAAEGVVLKNLKKGIIGKFVNIEFQKKITDEDMWGGVHPEQRGIKNTRRYALQYIEAKRKRRVRDVVSVEKHVIGAQRAFRALWKAVKPLYDEARSQYPGKSKAVIKNRARAFSKMLRTNRDLLEYTEVWIGPNTNWGTRIVYALRDLYTNSSYSLKKALVEVQKQATRGYISMEMGREQANIREVIPEDMMAFLPKNIVVRVDDSGKISEVTDRFENERLTLAKKIKTQKTLVKRYNRVAKKVKKDLKSSDEMTRLSALVTSIIMETGIRPGKAGNSAIKTVDGEKVNVETFGAVTLGPSHVKVIRDDFASLEFVGKKTTINTAQLSDSQVVGVLNDYVKKALTKGSQFVFVTDKGARYTYSDLQSYFRNTMFKDISPTDFRKLRATRMVLESLHSEQEAMYADILKFVDSEAEDLKEKVAAAVLKTVERAYAKAQEALSHEDVKTTISAYINPEILLRFLSQGHIESSLEKAVLEGAGTLSFDPSTFVNKALGKRAATSLQSILDRLDQDMEEEE